MTDDVVRLSGLEPLRNKPLRPDEVEIRLWRGFGLHELEVVVLNNRDGIWKGKHLLGNDYVEITDVKVVELPEPKLGWERFGHKLVELGIVDLPTSYDDECLSGIDGTSNVVEVSKQGSYRIYMYREDAQNCMDGQKLDVIAEFVGIQFDHADAECKGAEWFPCSKHLRKYRLEKESQNPDSH